MAPPLLCDMFSQLVHSIKKHDGNQLLPPEIDTCTKYILWITRTNTTSKLYDFIEEVADDFGPDEFGPADDAFWSMLECLGEHLEVWHNSHVTFTTFVTHVKTIYQKHFGGLLFY